MNEKIYKLNNDEFDVINFTKEKLFCRIRSQQDDVNVCWISDEMEFDKDVIMFFRLFNKRAKENNLLTLAKKIAIFLKENCEDQEFNQIKEIFLKLYSANDIDSQLSNYQLLDKYNEFLFLALAYFVIEKCDANYLEIFDLIISFKNIKEFVALNFWDKHFK